MSSSVRLSHTPVGADGPGGPEAAPAKCAAAARARLAEYENCAAGAFGVPHPVYALLPPAVRDALYAGVPLEAILGPAPGAGAASDAR